MGWFARMAAALGFGRGEEPQIEARGLLPGAEYEVPTWWAGDKFYGGFGATELPMLDYWSLRARSAQLFEKNLYAKGLIRRLVTNEINSGLSLEASPEEAILGLEDDALSEWAEDVENRWALWCGRKEWCDRAQETTFGGLQEIVRRESLIEGDVLVVLHQDEQTILPQVQVVPGRHVRTPLSSRELPTGHVIEEGVELDSARRHVAYWVDDGAGGDLQRLPAWGPESGRRLAWLVYGLERRHGATRGTPMLGIILQSLAEIDRYRDSTQRKAVVTSMLAMFVEKTEPGLPSKPFTSGAVRRDSVQPVDGAGASRNFSSTSMIPGLVIEELQPGETPKAFPATVATEGFAVFEAAIIDAIAWAHEIPPEIVRLSFGSNYSASQAAINEFKQYLAKVRAQFGAQFCAPVYEDWLLSEVLSGTITASGMLESWRMDDRRVAWASWVRSEWAGYVKPAVDLSKLVKGYVELVNEGLITRARAARELTGTDFAKNVRRLARENRMLREAGQLDEGGAAAAPGLRSVA